MAKSPRRVRARNPFKYLLIAVVALGLIAAGGFIWYRQQQAIVNANTSATSTALQATSQGETAVAQVAQGAVTATAAATLAEIEQRYQAALAFQTAGDYEQARAGFQEIMTRNPGYKESAARFKQASDALADGYYQQAVAAADQKLWPDAVANFDKVLALVPNYKDTATRRAAAAKALNATATPKPATPTVQPTAAPAATSPITATAVDDASAPASDVVTATAVLSATNPPDAAAIPTLAEANPTPKALAAGKPVGDWAVRSYNTDDIGAVFVNGQLVAASLWGDHADSGWLKINEYLTADQENEIVVASWNSSYDRSWGFGVRHNDTQVWGSEKLARREQVGMSYVQRLRITSAGAVEPVPADTAAPKPPPGKWYVRVQGAQDLGVVLVNGTPTVLNASTVAPESGWIEITGQLTSSRDNTVTMVVWNFDADFTYNFQLKRDDTIVWGQSGKGGGVIGVAFHDTATISKLGQIVAPPLKGNLLEQSWAVRSYNTDDIGAVFVNGQLVAASLWGDHADSGWLKINEYLTADQENEIVVASWNSSYDRSWGFGVRHNDTQVWGSEEPARREQVGMSYVQRLRITSAGAVEPVPADTAAPKPPPGKWYVRVQGAQDLGVVLVNGIPTVLNASTVAPESGWVEITGQLTSSRDNTVTMVAWNFDGPYSYKFEIKHDETIVWGAEKSGGGQIGVALAQPVQISAKGEVKQ